MTKTDFYTDAEMAELLGIMKSTLIKNRSLGRNHPPFIKLGSRVIYPRKEFEAWVKAQPVHREIKAS